MTRGREECGADHDRDGCRQHGRRTGHGPVRPDAPHALDVAQLLGSLGELDVTAHQRIDQLVDGNESRVVVP